MRLRLARIASFFMLAGFGVPAGCDSANGSPDAVIVTMEGTNSPCGQHTGTVLYGTMTLNLNVRNNSDVAVTLDALISDGETMTFNDALLEPGAAALFVCKRSPVDSDAGDPVRVGASLRLASGALIEVSGNAQLHKSFDFCDTVGGPDFECTAVDAD